LPGPFLDSSPSDFEPSQIGRQVPHHRLALQYRDEEGARPGFHRRRAERLRQSFRHGNLAGRIGREVHFVAPVGPRHRQRSRTGIEGHAVGTAHIADQHMAAGQGGVAAQGHFHRRREPAQAEERGIGRLQQEGVSA
jgi:hypothetical protein